MLLTYFAKTYIIVAQKQTGVGKLSTVYGVHNMVIRHSVKDQVYLIIKERILRGDYPTGSPLNIAQLTTELGVSNTPLREALSILENEGLVVKSNMRYQVISLSDELNEDLNQVTTIQALGALDLCVRLA